MQHVDCSVHTRFSFVQLPGVLCLAALSAVLGSSALFCTVLCYSPAVICWCRYIGLVGYSRADGVEAAVPRTTVTIFPGY